MEKKVLDLFYTYIYIYCLYTSTLSSTCLPANPYTAICPVPFLVAPTTHNREDKGNHLTSYGVNESSLLIKRSPFIKFQKKKKKKLLAMPNFESNKNKKEFGVKKSNKKPYHFLLLL